MSRRAEIFHFISSLRTPSTKFDLSHGGLTELEMGQLVPIDVQECLPGDFWKIKESSLVKFASLLAPLQHRVDVSYHFFFVPTRLLWSHYEDFFTGGQNGDLAPVKPYFPAGAVFHPDITAGSLSNYLMKCNKISPSINIDLLPFKGYQLIWNEFFRDQNLQDPIDIEVDAEGICINPQPFLILRRRCWEKDYFTSALPFAQRGPEVLASLAGSAPVSGIYNAFHVSGGSQGNPLFITDDDPASGALALDDAVGSFNLTDSLDGIVGTKPYDLGALGKTGLFADLSGVSAFNIEDLRNLARTQEVLEASARAGGRYVEQLNIFWNVISPDARMQRPELIGYVNSPVQVSELLQTAPDADDGTTIDSGVGTQTGQAVSVNSSKSLFKFCYEHGFIYCLASVMPRTSYTNTLSRMFTRFDRFDYALPQFGHLGEQEVFNYEVNAAHQDPEGTFGYQSRYAEYKYQPDFYSGHFADNLQFWHLGRSLPADVALNSDFVTCTPRNNIFAVPNATGHIKVNIWFDMKVVRKLPRFGTPRL